MVSFSDIFTDGRESDGLVHVLRLPIGLLTLFRTRVTFSMYRDMRVRSK
jgi:hypothetical protein